MTSELVLEKNSIQQADRRFLANDQPSQELVDLVGVPREYSGYLRIVDQTQNLENNLVIIHYLTPLDTDGNPDETILAKIGSARGVIVDTTTNKIVCRSYSHTPELVNDAAQLAGKLNLNECTVFKACEGPVLRVYWHNGKWHISTHRKLDSAKSSWGGPPFAEMFLSTVNWSFDELDRSLAYSFLLSHPSHRHIYRVTEPQLLLISVYDPSTNSFLSMDRVTEIGTGLKNCLTPKPFDPQPKTIEEMCQMVDALDTGKNVSFDSVGAIVIHNTGDPAPVKIITAFYNSLKQARGNNVSLRTRYILVRGSDEENLLTAWFDEPQYQQLFALVENEIERLIKTLHKMYLNRFVHKNFGELPKEEFVILQRCHSWHKEDRGSNKVTMEKMRQVVEDTPNFYILKMLNRQRTLKRQSPADPDVDPDVDADTDED